MLEDMIFGVLAKTRRVPAAVRRELERLEAGGFVGAEEVERLSAEFSERWADSLKSLPTPSLRGLGRQLREVLDLPSREELEALREELRRARGSDQPSHDPAGSDPAGTDEEAARG